MYMYVACICMLHVYSIYIHRYIYIYKCTHIVYIVYTYVHVHICIPYREATCIKLWRLPPELPPEASSAHRAPRRGGSARGRSRLRRSSPDFGTVAGLLLGWSHNRDFDRDHHRLSVSLYIYIIHIYIYLCRLNAHIYICRHNDMHMCMALLFLSAENHTRPFTPPPTTRDQIKLNSGFCRADLGLALRWGLYDPGLSWALRDLRVDPHSIRNLGLCGLILTLAIMTKAKTRGTICAPARRTPPLRPKRRAAPGPDRLLRSSGFISRCRTSTGETHPDY